MQDCPFRLNPALDYRSLAARFGEDRRVHISDFLVLEDAQRLYEHLQQEVSWKLITRHGDKLYEFAAADFTQKQRDQLNLVTRQAHPEGIHYCFETIVVPDSDAERRRSPTLLSQFARFLSSETVISAVRTITGIREIAFADAQATKYGPGDYLSTHNDDLRSDRRRAAYAFNLTPAWDADWGGLLAFFGADGHGERAYTPAFNALNLFAVPLRHSVTMVTPFAGARRYSVSGWFRGGRRPA